MGQGVDMCVPKWNRRDEAAQQYGPLTSFRAFLPLNEFSSERLLSSLWLALPISWLASGVGEIRHVAQAWKLIL